MMSADVPRAKSAANPSKMEFASGVERMRRNASVSNKSGQGWALTLGPVFSI